MSEVDIIVPGEKLAKLKALLLKPDGVEHAAYVLFGISRIGCDPFTGQPRLRLMVRDILPVESSEIRSSDSQHISWSTARFVSLLAKAAREGFQVGIAHSHPSGPRYFSPQDDRNEADLVRLAQNRNGGDTILPSLLFSAGEMVAGRVWTSPIAYKDIAAMRVTGANWRVMGQSEPIEPNDAVLARQSLALGAGFNLTMRRLKIGVVGAGGTGSPIIQQLARMGLGHLAIFDPDTVEASNLNRLYGSTIDDARSGAKKVDVARREIERIGLEIQVVTFDAWIGADECRDALKSMDIILGCTDDNDGRALLNRLAYYYLIPVIDLGLALKVGQKGGEDVLEAEGRVTVLEPGTACLLCRRVIDPTVAAEEALRRNDPAEYERRKAEAYVRGEGNPSPAVISFTTSVATMAIEELIQRLQQFRGSEELVANRLRKFTLMEDFRPGTKQDGCSICGSSRIHGLGDIEPFLGRAG